MVRIELRIIISLFRKEGHDEKLHDISLHDCKKRGKISR